MFPINKHLLPLLACAWLTTAPAFAQAVPHPLSDSLRSVPAAASSSATGQAQAQPAPTDGYALPDSDKLHVRVEFMAAWVDDPVNAPLGLEKQARVGFLIVGLRGKLSDRFRYVAEINPVHENTPLPACGETNYFFPNAAQNIGPAVQCHPDGRTRVDDYRYIGLDPVPQQGMIRQAYLEYTSGSFGFKAGRFILPIGLTWQETGAFTAKDTPHIARINTEANFGAGFSWRHGTAARIEAFAVLGDGNRFHDYDYYYFMDNAYDTNSALTALVSGAVTPVKGLELRGAYKFGYTGSKVESTPNFYASKRNDQALVASVRYSPIPAVTIFGEYARYTWGPTETSAAMLGLDTAPVIKPGYYVGAEGRYPIGRFRLGGSFVREELSRDDALVKYQAEMGLYRAELGKKERATFVRVFVDAPGGVRAGWFYVDHSNPFPQLSGIVPVSGPSAYQAMRGWGKSGLMVQFTFH